MKNQGCLLMAEGGRRLDINRQSLLRNPKVFCRRSLTDFAWLGISPPSPLDLSYISRIQL